MKYSRKSLDKAGVELLDPFARTQAIEKVGDWRSLHLPILREFVEKLTQYLNENNVPFSFYSQRIKRMTSIINKLQNNPKMGLGGLQDIGGARFVFNTIDELECCKKALEIFTPANFTLNKTNDYIQKPKQSGYRSIHYVYKYHSDDKDYDGIQIELQIRTRLEHSWAMAVETASLISRTSLKANIDDGSVWREFFKCVSAIFAQREGKPVESEFVSYTHDRYCKLYNTYVSKKLPDQLRALRVTVNWDKLYEDATDGYCVLSINFIQRVVSYKIYPSENEDKAVSTFSQLEKSVDSNEAVLLVSIAKMIELRDAYPSYFLDTEGFLQALSEFEESCGI